MCERYSWIEKDGHVLFLTPYDVFETSRGKKLQKHTPRKEDWYGHGSIRWYYDNLQGGEDCECTDFATPKNFPPELAEAIKTGKMWGFGITYEMHAMLRSEARTEYDKVCDSALVKYCKVCAAAWTRRNKVCDSAWPEYGKACKAACAEYDKVCDSARAKDDKVRIAAFAKLFAQRTNRIKAWQ